MTKRRLIVNADDCNLTPGVTQAILDCHDRGILTSTTFMVNLPLETWTLHQLLKRKQLGVGIHLNVTLGQPLSKPSKIKSLLGPEGKFRKQKEQLKKPPRHSELRAEYEAQFNFFMKVFGRKPTHLDTHHQMHDHPHFYEVFSHLAKKYKVPIRRSRAQRREEVRTSDYFFGNLTVEGYWRKEPLLTILSHLPEGISEIMCHPGKNDHDLQKISSFTAGREVELRLFSSPAVRRFVQRQGVMLTHFGLCYNL